MARKPLGQQLSEITRKYEVMLEATAKEAAQSLVEEVQTPRPKGGKLPVDTSFLRNSMSGALNSTPSGPATKPAGYTQTDWDASPILLVINRVKIGDRLVLGYTANYAPYMEARYAFVRSAAQNWNQHVDKAARKVRREVG